MASTSRFKTTLLNRAKEGEVGGDLSMFIFIHSFNPHHLPEVWGGAALPCDPPEGDPGQEGGAGLRARILVERKHRFGRKRERNDSTFHPGQSLARSS